MFRGIIVLSLLITLGGCTPAHNIKPLPNFVETALAPDDRIQVTDVNGTTTVLVVTEIRDNTIFGEDFQIAIGDIAKLQKLSWSRPDSPCGNDLPLGCSVPLLVRISSESHNYYRGRFYEACAQHDYCYRHGFRTYGVSREDCDSEFLKNMQAACPRPARNLITKTIELVDDSVGGRRVCLLVANDFHRAVRSHGQAGYATEDSTYCEYDGPPPQATK